jgi:transcriptional regulator with XRE-family HTH domain
MNLPYQGLRRLREISKLTQREVAERMGCSHATYQELETRTLVANRPQKIDRALRVIADEIERVMGNG